MKVAEQNDESAKWDPLLRKILLLSSDLFFPISSSSSSATSLVLDTHAALMQKSTISVKAPRSEGLI
jgi:hypothetical protein